jgi:TfoX/Sxy family transcriptional regulator of competence genes
MEWKKSPPGLVAAFERAAPKDPSVVRKSMFGYPALFLNGNMFAFTFQDRVAARLPEADLERAVSGGSKRFEPMPGRPMKEYILVPASDVTNGAVLASWIERAHRHAKTLPAKAAKPRADARPVERVAAKTKTKTPRGRRRD